MDGLGVPVAGAGPLFWSRRYPVGMGHFAGQVAIGDDAGHHDESGDATRDQLPVLHEH